ncbi:putative amidohydrolase [Roseivirga ehrenbergii]|uniref:Acyltransferase n=1 Tax=Roseivirga ehrenbergii (strain DSM 102268 / JCM 13514 / KCTC 12282 / NCIMB 14502 / KMM 6017) TaxID=279360 RepID=A0A150XQQ8_ROSEK|nr:carbon-nitrogen hydrolase family protein [Roseivirga ehrenbergii]KYG81070.1 acyltransferase [Roseivirga ehrenbergii]TCL00942.1 putative amidohydrolase [Roseivirga ehrenbergii]
MKICVAQTKPFTGTIEKNIIQHLKLVSLAIEQGVELIIFPELSLTGYEPTLANTLAISKDDARLTVFQEASSEKNITIGVGAPIKTSQGIAISMILFQPNQSIQVYSKGHLHADELPYFISGNNSLILQLNSQKIALAICYEISIPEHSEKAFQNGARLYIASVAKFKSGINKARTELANIAKRYSMNILMANCIGMSDGEECAGKTAAWNKEGEMICELNEVNEGLLIFDNTTQTTEKYLL